MPQKFFLPRGDASIGPRCLTYCYSFTELLVFSAKSLIEQFVTVIFLRRKDSILVAKKVYRIVLRSGLISVPIMEIGVNLATVPDINQRIRIVRKYLDALGWVCKSLH